MEKRQVVAKTKLTKGMEVAIAQRYVAGERIEDIAKSFKIYSNRVWRVLHKNERVKEPPRAVLRSETRAAKA
jgi:hypothetical protein